METLGPWEISPGFLQTVYFTVAIAMALTVICLNWEWIERWLYAKRRAEETAQAEAMRRFQRLIQELAQVRALIFSEHSDPPRRSLLQVRHETRLRIDRLIVLLDSVRIPHPPAVRSEESRQLVGEWLERLNSLMALAAIGDLDQTRELRGSGETAE